MKKYYKRMLTYYEVSENGNYLAVTPLMCQVTVTIGSGFRPTSTETEIDELEFRCEINEPMQRFLQQCQAFTSYETTI